MTHGGDTTAVAFVPGFMQRGDAWAPIASQLPPRFATRLVDFGEPTLDAHVEAVLRAGRGGAVVGYSMGGRIALQAALREPAAFAALVVVGASAGIEDPDERRARRKADGRLAAWMEARKIDAVVAYWEAQGVFGTQTQELVESQRPGRLSHNPRKLAQVLRETGQGVVDHVWGELDQLTLPVLVIAGRLDRKYAGDAERMAEALPNGHCALIEGAGHAPHLERPEDFIAALVEFLDEHLGEGVVVDDDA